MTALYWHQSIVASRRATEIVERLEIRPIRPRADLIACGPPAMDSIGGGRQPRSRVELLYIRPHSSTEEPRGNIDEVLLACLRWRRGAAPNGKSRDRLIGGDQNASAIEAFDLASIIFVIASLTPWWIAPSAEAGVGPPTVFAFAGGPYTISEGTALMLNGSGSCPFSFCGCRLGSDRGFVHRRCRVSLPSSLLHS